MIGFHSCEYYDIEDAKKHSAFYETGSSFDKTYSNLYDYYEIINTLCNCMGIESGEITSYFKQEDGTYLELYNNIKELDEENKWQYE